MRRKVRVFYNGQYQGYMRQTWRLCGRCRSCVDDAMKGDVPAVSLYDEDDKPFSRVTRKGRGCCCTMGANCPCKCVYGALGLTPRYYTLGPVLAATYHYIGAVGD